jgi:prostaglandin-endoperoxide synthase 2
MGSVFEDVLIEIGSSVLGKAKINEILIDRLVGKGRTRPHPWSTRCGHICWSGLTDRTYNARLLPPKPHVGPEGMGTARPPIDQVALLFAADPAGQRVCPKSTVLFPAFAQYLTDGFIRTMMSNKPPFGDGFEDRARTTSNHDIDLSPLYGRNPEQTAVLREDPAVTGRKGRLKSQIVNGEEYPPFLYDPADPNLRTVKAEFCKTVRDPATGQPVLVSVLDQPLGVADSPARQTMFAVGGDRANATPHVAMINIVLLREHNRLAAMIEANNPAWDDDAVFQTTRNILIVMYIKFVVEEYINHINTAKFRVSANPKPAWGADWNRPNWMTVEFSLLYRWHSLIPSKLKLGGNDIPIAALLLDNRPLLNGGLAAAFADVSANNATELGLGNSDPIFVSVATKAEIRAVLQGRSNEVASYNDYRRAMKRKPATSFEQLVGETKDAKEKARRAALALKLKALYGDIENLEYYVGIFAEPRSEDGPLPSLITAMVAMDAFSQAFTNPLLSEHVWGNKVNRESAFTAAGLEEIEKTGKIRDLVARNTNNLGNRFVGMTRQDWKHS